jgi:hypothetical protein
MKQGDGTGISGGSQDAVPMPQSDVQKPSTDDPIEREPLTLHLQDLLPDAGGEIVILDRSGDGIALLTDQPPTAQGIGASHVTDGGIDVSGYAYCSFSSGLTVFYSSLQKLIVLPDV